MSFIAAPSDTIVAQHAAIEVIELMPSSSQPIYNSAPFFAPSSTTVGSEGTDVYTSS